MARNHTWAVCLPWPFSSKVALLRGQSHNLCPIKLCGLQGPQSTSCDLRSEVYCMQSVICSLQSAVCSLQSAVCSLQSAVCSLQMSDTGKNRGPWTGPWTRSIFWWTRSMDRVHGGGPCFVLLYFPSGDISFFIYLFTRAKCSHMVSIRKRVNTGNEKAV